ncbi:MULTISPECIES: IS3 family transposase [unclassified Adlercreutzia]|uniref:IS3 family transposase n=1 Tax=unclassified Adlercreutzia TaxID=2636013 RepID=UPI0013EAF93C|nr:MULTISPECIES: IS3 family transposase [unclassified Adlercreutzia]
MIDDIGRDELLGEIDSLKDKIAGLEAEARFHKMEVAIWKGAAELVKKDPGIDPGSLSNREKATLVDALKTTFPLNELLRYLGLARSSYYYQEKVLSAPDKYKELRKLVKEEFEAEGGARGHRTIWVRLRKRETPVIVSEKVVLRIMKEEGLEVPYSNTKKRRYSSYAGEIDQAPENLVGRDFHADAPNALWLTDITRFTLSGFKCYLSPVIDCFDGKVVSQRISLHPDAELVNTMLDDAIATLSDGEHPICHNDRGCHYRWPGWIERCENAGIMRSMSKKGCSPDNSACEGFFGRLKNEFFYGRDWKGVSFEEFSRLLNGYIEFYNGGRIKRSLGWMSPNEYRRSLGLAA